MHAPRTAEELERALAAKDEEIASLREQLASVGREPGLPLNGRAERLTPSERRIAELVVRGRGKSRRCSARRDPA